MSDYNNLLNLRPVSTIDKENGYATGDDHILSKGEPGYDKLIEALDKVPISHSNKFPIGDFSLFEMMDIHPGFSPLERVVADKFININDAYRQNIISQAKEGMYPYDNSDLSAAQNFKNIIRQFYLTPLLSLDTKEKLIDYKKSQELAAKYPQAVNELYKKNKLHNKDARWMLYPFTDDYIDGIVTAIEIGKDIALNSRNPDQIIINLLPNFFTRYIINSTAFYIMDTLKPAKIPPGYQGMDLLSVQDIIRRHFAGPLGYYERGLDANKVLSYQSPVDGLSPLYGKLMAHYIFNFYRELRDKGLISPNGDFVVYEHGGGNGRLAEDVLSYVQQKGAEDEEWMRFSKTFKYIGVEISTYGAEKQALLKARFNNFDIVQADAITWKPEKKKNGIAISVLLVDSFAPHLIVKSLNRIFVAHIVPTLFFDTNEERDGYLKDYLDLGIIDRILVNSANNHIKKDYLNIRHDMFSHIYLSKDCFTIIEEKIASLRSTDPKAYEQALSDFLNRLGFRYVLVDADNVPEVKKFLNAHPSVADRVPENDLNYYINTDLDKYIKNVAENYFQIGGFMTVDIGSIFLDRLGLAGGLPFVSRPLLTMQRGRVHLTLHKIPSEIFGETLIYLAPDPQLMMETLDEVSLDQGRIRPHDMLLRNYPDDIKKDYPAISQNLKSLGYNNEVALNVQGVFDTMFFSAFESAHRVFEAPIGQKKYLNALVWHSKFKDLTGELKEDCNVTLDSLLKKNIDWGNVKPCLYDHLKLAGHIFGVSNIF